MERERFADRTVFSDILQMTQSDSTRCLIEVDVKNSLVSIHISGFYEKEGFQDLRMGAGESQKHEK